MRESNKDRANSGATDHPRTDPATLSTVSDFLKRSLTDRPYAFILDSLGERLELKKVDKNLKSVGLIPVPHDFDLKKLYTERTVAFMPYCCKPLDCPLNAESPRKSTDCNAPTDECDHLSCSLSRYVYAVRKLGVSEFRVIDNDSSLFEWLVAKRKEGYTHVIGAACEFAMCYALEVIHNQLNFDGLIVTINGDKCKTQSEYSESDSEDRGRFTFIDSRTLSVLESIIDEIVTTTEKPFC